MIQVSEDTDRLPLKVNIKGQVFYVSALKKEYVVEAVEGGKPTHCIWYPTLDDHDFTTALFSTGYFPGGSSFIQLDAILGDYASLGFATFPTYEETLETLKVLCAEINKITRG